MEETIKWILAAIVAVLLLALIFIAVSYPLLRERGVIDLVQYPQSPVRAELEVASGLSQCPEAPFIVPTSG